MNIVQKANGVVSASGGAVSFANATQAGNVVVWMVCWPSYGTSFLPSSDDAGNVVLPRGGSNFATTVDGPPATVGSESGFGIIQNPNDNSNFCLPMKTLTLTGPSRGNVSVWMFELSGMVQKNFHGPFGGALMDSQYFTQQSTFTGTNDLAGTPQAAPLFSPAGTSYGGSNDRYSQIIAASDPTKSYFIVSCIAPTTQGGGTAAISGVNSGFNLEPLQNGFACAWQISAGGYDAIAQQMAFTNPGSAFYSAIWISLAGGPVTPPPPPPPPPGQMTCAPVDMTSGNPLNGVFIASLGLFIIPAYALYSELVPFSQISVNESLTQGRHGIVLDFNDSEGLYVRDLGTLFTWGLNHKTILEVWQPSIIPMDGEIYDRLSYHFTMTSLQGQGWQHAREMNIAYESTTPLNLLLTFDQWPNITLTLPSTNGATIKQKLTLPPNKWKMVELFLSSASPFKMWSTDVELKTKSWGSADAYRLLRPVSG